jgi:hypothetical protein
MTILMYIGIALGVLVLLGLISYFRAAAKVPTYDTKTLLDGLALDTQTLINVAKTYFEPLSIDQLRRRPNPTSWSVGECLQHLNLYGEYYIPALQKALQAEGQPQPTFKGSVLGEYFANLMRPKNDGQPKSKMPTFKDKNPIAMQLEVPADIVQQFVTQQEDMLKCISAARQKNLYRPKITITISRLIALSIGDTLRFNTYHAERHVAQAMRTLHLRSDQPESRQLLGSIQMLDSSATEARFEEMSKKIADKENNV